MPTATVHQCTARHEWSTPVQWQRKHQTPRLYILPVLSSPLDNLVLKTVYTS